MRSRQTLPNSAAVSPTSASILIPLMACVSLFALTGCDKAAEVKTPQTSDEFNWARAALERNPTIEVMAADAETGVFTIKVKRTGNTQAIELSELAAAPVSEFVAAALATPATSAVAANTPIEPATPAAEEPPARTEEQLVAAANAAPHSSISASNYTIERSAGQLKVSGPGVSIVSAGPGSRATAQREQGQRTAEPVICEGRRLLHFDNRNIYVDGNAIVARGGCELYITNSHIVSSGTGVVASDAIVHIANSTIEGGQASFEAGDGAKMYLRSSTFQGLPRRAEKSVVQDQGGNTWR